MVSIDKPLIALLISLSLLGCSNSNYSGYDNMPEYDSDNYDPKQAALVQKEGKALVDKAVAYMTEGRYYEANGLADSQCGGTIYNYRLHKENTGIVLTERIALSSDQSLTPEHKKTGFDQIQNCLSPINMTMHRYGMRVALDIRWEEDFKSSNVRFDRKVDIHFGLERGHASQWTDGIRDNCYTILHELGHHWGLPDEYSEEGTCRKEAYAATETMPISLMKSGYNEEGEFYPRHILQLLEQAIPLKVEMSLLADSTSSELLNKMNSTPNFKWLKPMFFSGFPNNLAAGFKLEFEKQSGTEIYISFNVYPAKFNTLASGGFKASIEFENTNPTQVRRATDAFSKLDTVWNVQMKPFTKEDFQKYPTLRYQADFEH